MPSITNTIDKIRSFTELSQGWHFGEGVPLSCAFAERAVALVRRAGVLGIQRANAGPDENGGVQVTFHHNDDMLEINLEADDSLSVALDQDDVQVAFRDNVTLGYALFRLKQFSDCICDTSESYTQTSSTKKLTDFSAWPFLSAATAASQSLIVTVLPQQAVQFAPIYGVSTATKPESRQSIGIFPAISSQTVV